MVKCKLCQENDIGCLGDEESSWFFCDSLTFITDRMKHLDWYTAPLDAGREYFIDGWFSARFRDDNVATFGVHHVPEGVGGFYLIVTSYKGRNEFSNALKITHEKPEPVTPEELDLIVEWIKKREADAKKQT